MTDGESGVSVSVAGLVTAIDRHPQNPALLTVERQLPQLASAGQRKQSQLSTALRKFTHQKLHFVKNIIIAPFSQ